MPPRRFSGHRSYGLKRQNHATVYFAQGVDGGNIKIGCTAVHVEERLEQLQNGSPVILQVIAMTDGGERMERGVHARFAHLRAHGEWFRPAPELLEFIEAFRIEPIRVIEAA